MGPSRTYLLWLVAFCSINFSIYSMLPWVYGKPYHPLWSAIMFPLNLFTWSVAVGLVIYLSTTREHSNWIGQLLSHPVFRPLSRITYSVYLTHVWVVWTVLGARRELIDLHNSALILLFVSVVSVAFVIGFLFTIVFESPVLCALGLVRRRLMNAKQPSPQKTII